MNQVVHGDQHDAVVGSNTLDCFSNSWKKLHRLSLSPFNISPNDWPGFRQPGAKRDLPQVQGLPPCKSITCNPARTSPVSARSPVPTLIAANAVAKMPAPETNPAHAVTLIAPLNPHCSTCRWPVPLEAGALTATVIFSPTISSGDGSGIRSLRWRACESHSRKRNGPKNCSLHAVSEHFWHRSVRGSRRLSSFSTDCQGSSPEILVAQPRSARNSR